jgi:hypothetical protein
MRIFLSVCVAVLAACSKGKTEEQKQVDELTSAINEFAGSLKKGKTELQTTLAEHEAIVHNKDGDYIGHYKKFNGGLEDVEERRADVRKRVEEVKTAAASYFARWEANLGKYQDEELKKKSKERMDETKARYEKVHAEGTKARDHYEPLIKTLKEHALFWGTELNAEAAKALDKDSEKIQKESDGLKAAIDAVLAACDSYNKSVAMKTEPPPPAAEKKQ